MKPDDPLLQILACPLDKGPLSLLAPDDVLYNPRLRRRYPILDGIPQLLPSSGEQVTDAEHDRILGRLRDAADPAPSLADDPGPTPAAAPTAGATPSPAAPSPGAPGAPAAAPADAPADPPEDGPAPTPAPATPPPGVPGPERWS